MEVNHNPDRSSPRIVHKTLLCFSSLAGIVAIWYGASYLYDFLQFLVHPAPMPVAEMILWVVFATTVGCFFAVLGILCLIYDIRGVSEPCHYCGKAAYNYERRTEVFWKEPAMYSRKDIEVSVVFHARCHELCDRNRRFSIPHPDHKEIVI